jgi:hypothetical protein
MTNRFLKKYLKKQSTELMLVMGILLYILQTTPVHCGECLIGECRQTSSGYVSPGDVGCHKPIKEKKCCSSESVKKLNHTVSVVDDCSSCNCQMKGVHEDQTNFVLASSVHLQILFVPGFSDSSYVPFNLTSCTCLALSKPKVGANPIFVLNSTYLI